MLRHLEDARLPAVRRRSASPARPERGDAILVTEYLAPLAPVPAAAVALPARAGRVPRPAARRDGLLLVDLHRGGVFWGDCSLANTLFRRDGDRIQAFLVDAETSEVHPDAVRRPARLRPRDPRRERRLRPRRRGDAPGPRRRTSTRRSRRPSTSATATRRSGASSTSSRAVPGDRHAIRGRLRRLNDLGFAVDLESTRSGRTARCGCGRRCTTRRYHAHELERLTGIRALEGQARLLLNDLPSTGVARVLRAPGGRPRRRPPIAGGATSSSRRCAGSAGDRRPRPRPRPGLLRRARAQVAAVRARRARRRPRGRDRGLPRRGRAGARASSGDAAGRRRAPTRRWTTLDARGPRDDARRTEPLSRSQRSRWTTSSSGRRPPARRRAVSIAGSAG